MTRIRSWQVRTASVRGAGHLTNGAPNQDACGSATSDDGLITVVCVADGHGSARSFRSDVGASLAVEIGLSAVTKHLETGRDTPDAELEAAARELRTRILANWRREVAAHVQRHPFTDSELARAGIEAPPDTSQLEVVYGATLLMAGVTPRRALLAQLGDGDIVWRHDGAVGHPLGEVDDDLGDATYSLASGEAAVREWRVGVFSWEQPPDLIVLSTDGYGKAFTTDFLDVIADLHGRIDEHGLAAVGEHLPGWLRTASTEGSRDDVTVALMVPTVDDLDGAGGGSSEPTYSNTAVPRRRAGGVAAVLLALALGIAGWLAGAAGWGPDLGLTSEPPDSTEAPTASAVPSIASPMPTRPAGASGLGSPRMATPSASPGS